MNIIFTKPTGRSLTGLSKRHKNKKDGKYEDQPKSIWARYVRLAHKMQIKGNFMPTGQGMKILLGANSKENLFFFDK
jgi:hypothetical protein